MSSVKTRKTRQAMPLYLATAVIVLALLAVAVQACHKSASAPEITDPHAGQVLINDGANTVWITPAEGVDPAGFAEADFRTRDGLPCYVGSAYTVWQGIDISEYQAPVDWDAVKADGIDFVLIRCGWRGYVSGSITDDIAFSDHVRGAKQAGIQVGAYFFSQAVTPEEAKEEAQAALALLQDHPVSLPVFFDWERPADEDARTRTVELSDLTGIAQAFCDTIRQGGYTPGIYFNRQLGYYAYDWAQLKGCARWVADPNDWPDFYYGVDFWQYSFDGKVDGIEIQTDRNLMFVKQ